MSSRILLPLLLGLTGLSAVHAAPVEAPITEVTVFPDRAVVTRTGSIEIPTGITEITVPDLPEGLLSDSLQVSARADAPLTILDVRSATRFGGPEGIDRVRPLLEKQEELSRKIDRIDLDLTALRQQREFLGKIESAVTGKRTEGDPPSPEQWNGLLEFFREALRELLPAIYEQETAREELQQELEAVKKEIAQTQGAERAQTREAIIRLETENSARGDFTVSYTIMNAGWNPEYNVRVRSADKEVQLDYQATVRQQTGEDWNDVRLTLSTARPALGGAPPELQPWRVGPRTPPPPPRPVQSRMQSYADMEAAPEPPMEQLDAGFRAAEVESSLTAVSLRVPAGASVPADGEPHRVGIDSIPLEGDFYYTVIPKLSTHAFLQAEVTNPGPAPLLAGRANIFLDGNLAGHSRVPRVEPDQEFELPIGVDEAIVVERKLLRRFVERRGLLSKSTRTRFEFETVITNQRPTIERLIVKDHVPVSQHENIKVDLVEASGGKEDENAPGFYEWDFSLHPGAERKILLTFTVEHPEDMDVSGL